MARETYKTLAAKAAGEVREIMPWDLARMQGETPDILVLDVRERNEYEIAHIAGSLNVPRGILESACEWDYAETVPELVEARGRPVVIVCRSGNRSALAAVVMRLLGYENVASLKLGIKGWNDADLPLVVGDGERADADETAERLEPPLAPDQIDPARRKS